MEQDFLARIKELYERCENSGVLTYTGFLTPSEQIEIVTMQKKHAMDNVYLFGGHSEAERKIAFFLPYYIDAGQFEAQEYIGAFLAETKFACLSHRDFLGALLGLGVTRECIGDIYVQKEQAHFFVLKRVAEFVALNLFKVGASGVSLHPIGLDALNMPQKSVKLSNFTIKSARIDSLASGIFGVSRAKMTQMIESGLVFLNYQQCLSKDTEMKEHDIISVRGYGKAKVISFGGTSKKGRTFVTAEIYQ